MSHAEQETENSVHTTAPQTMRGTSMRTVIRGSTMPQDSARWRRGHAPIEVVVAVTGVGALTVAGVTQAMSGVPSEPIITNAAFAFAAIGLVWFGRTIIAMRDDVRTLVDPRSGVFTRLDAVEHRLGTMERRFDAVHGIDAA